MVDANAIAHAVMSVNHCWATGISRLIGIHPSVLVVPQHVGDYPVAAGIGPGVSLTSATICVVTTLHACDPIGELDKHRP